MKDKDLPPGHHGETLEENLQQIKDFFEGWRGSGSLRNQQKNHLEERWQRFSKVYKSTGDSVKDFLVFLQWDNESWWKQSLNPHNSPEQRAIGDYMMQQNVKIQDAFERIVQATGD
jgi:hypothetical protein